MGSQADGSTDELVVDFAGEVVALGVGEELLFGRAATSDLVIDANPLLHRKCGRFFHRDGSWWLRNEGRRIPLNIQDAASPSSVILTSGREASLTFEDAAVVFTAGSSTYELLISVDVPSTDEDDADEDSADEVPEAGEALLTMDQSHVPLVGDQRLLAVALAEHKLRNPHAPTQLPSNRAVAHRFGWGMPKFNRKLDRMCKKYARAGVSGLVGAPGDLASGRRQKLVEHLVSTGVISLLDLDLLDDHPAS